MANKVNAKDGRGFKSGAQIMSMIKLEVMAVPEVNSHRVAGQRNMSHQTVGINYTGTISQFKADRSLINMIKEYKRTGVFPVFDISAVQETSGSDFAANVGAPDRITVKGVQLTGDIPLMMIDADGELVMEELSFVAFDIN